jgi:hypothetical protein
MHGVLQLKANDPIRTAWMACNPHIPFPRQLGELAAPVIPDDPEIRRRSLKPTRKLPRATAQAA